MELLLVLLLFGLTFRQTLPRSICKIDEISSGKWSYHMMTEKSFKCCDFESPEVYCAKNPIPNPHSDTIRYSLTGYSNELVRIGGHACQCDRSGKTLEKASAREKWIWKPENCRLLEWNASYFCELLGDRKMLFVGDSTSFQTAGTLMNLIVAGKGKCASQIILDVVVQLGRKNYNFRNNIIKKSPTFIIVGVGPHYHRLDAYNASLVEAMKDLRTLHQPNSPNASLHIIWRSINFPHQHCDSYDSPTHLPHHFVPDNTRYDWNLFPVYDELARYYAGIYGIPFLDMFPLKLRPDSHPAGGDCLHYCTPGPLNIIGNMMLHYLYHEKKKN
eukprot:gene4937-5296_t